MGGFFLLMVVYNYYVLPTIVMQQNFVFLKFSFVFPLQSIIFALKF